MRWPILRALAMSWVIDTAVAPRSLTHFTISSLMTSAMIGSRPVVGSSKKMISGSRAMARASATRFCMPPRQLGGEQLADLGPEPDIAELGDRHLARLRRAACRRSGSGRRRRSPRPAANRTARRPGTACRTCACTLAAAAVAEIDRLLAVDLDRAAVGLHQAEDALQQHRLAGARAADHHQRFARPRRRGRCRAAPAWARRPW